MTDMDHDTTAALRESNSHMLEALQLSLKRLTELNRDDEAGMRIVIANAIAKATGATR